MNRAEWKPKVGDRVKVNAVGHRDCLGVVEWAQGPTLFGIKIEGRVSPFHLRNLDPVLEDERTGKPRPPIRVGEEMDVTIRATVFEGRGNCLRVLPVIAFNGYPSDYPNVARVERRVQNLGREARKS